MPKTGDERKMTALIRQVCDTVRDAGAIIRSAERYRGDGMQKGGDRNYVTEYDVRVQNHLHGTLTEICPEAAFCGEENGEQGMGETAWIVDPIDGTSNFIHGTGMSAVSVALAHPERNETLLAVVYNPYTDELFTAERGSGAFLNGEQIAVSRHDYAHALIGFGTTPYDRTRSEATFALLAAAYRESLDIRRSGSAALDLVYLAAGRLDGFFEMTLQPWDYAAGELLVTEAGGRITRFNGELPDLKRPSSILAGNAPVYEALFQMAAPYAKTVW